MARCTSNLRCEGPESQERCYPQACEGEACDFKYKICRTELVCKKGKCVSQKDAFKGEEGDECGGSEGRKCEAGLGCSSWHKDKTGSSRRLRLQCRAWEKMRPTIEKQGRC